MDKQAIVFLRVLARIKAILMKSRSFPLRLSILAASAFGVFFILNSSIAHAAYFMKDTNGTLTTGLVSYYRMEGDSTDFFGSNNGTDASMSYGSGYGKVNQGVGLNGSNSYSHTASIIPVGTSAASVSAWVNLGSLPFPGAYVIWSQTNDATTGDFQIGVNTNGFFVNAINNSGTHYQKAVGMSPATSTWYNVVGTFGSGQITLYVDGVNEGSVSVPGTIGTSDNAQIGRQDMSGYYYYLPGDVDEVGLWTKTLSSQEVPDLYNGGTGDTMESGLSSVFLNQYKQDGTTTIPDNGTTTESAITFGAVLGSSGTSTLQLQVEVEPAGSSNFTGTPNATSTFVSPGGYATATYSLAPELSANGNYHWQARVVDANSSSSAWQIFGPSSTSTDFTVQTIPLFTQIGSPYPSFASTSVVDGGWAGDTYDDGTIFCGGGNKIGYCGCAITSVAMDLRYFGIATDKLGDPVDPRTLNTWLTNDPNVGYDAGGNLEWNQITDYASSTSGSIILDTNSPSGYGTTISAMSPHINPLLASSTPVPVILVEPDHFVVATGLAQNNGTSTYSIRDSAWYLTQYLNQATSSDTSSTVNGYQNNASGAFIFYDPPQVPRWGEYHVSLPDALMLVDAQGRRTGKDPATGTIYREIPNTSYIEIGTPTTNGAGELFTSDLPNGRYTLYILGGKTTKYWLDASQYGQKHQSFKGTIQPGSMILYAQNYDMARLASSTFTFAGMASSTLAITSNPPHNLLPPPVPTPVQLPTSPVSVPVSPSNLGRPLSGSPLNSAINLGTSTASSSSSQ